MRTTLVLLVLFAQLSPSGLSYEERLAYGAQFIAQVREIARQYCGQPYFGTVCDWAR